MKDGNVNRTEEQVEVSRQQLYEHYVNSYLQLCPEVRPCRDAWLLENAAQYLMRDPEPEPGAGPGGTFTVFPLCQAVTHRWSTLSSDCCKHLAAVIRAAEQLETICVNLFLQPWRKEIRTLKTFTGPFVYCLLPVLSSSTIQSVLASIGYLLHTDTPQSEYRLSEEANPDRAMLLGFELLLARVECSHLLELLEKDQLGPQELLQVLQRKVGPTNLEEPTEKKTTIGQKEEEEKKKKKKKEEADRKEVPPYSDTRLSGKPRPKPRAHHPIGVDQSIMEMQMTYPDLAFRGRPLVRDKPHRKSSRKSSSTDVHPSSHTDVHPSSSTDVHHSSSTDVHPSSSTDVHPSSHTDVHHSSSTDVHPSSSTDVHPSCTNNYSDGSKAAELPNRDCTNGTKAAATTIRKNDGSKADEVFGGGGGGCNDSTPGDTVRADDELSGPQDISLHITLRTRSTAELSLKPGEPQPTAEPPAWTQQHTGADLHDNIGVANPKLPSLSSMDEVQELRELAERMGQLHVQDTKEEVKMEEDNTKKERRKKERKASTEEQTGRGPSHAAGRCSRSSQCDPAVETVCHLSPLAGSPTEYQSCRGGDGTGQQDGDHTVNSVGRKRPRAVDV
ncbi:uncharacterized protein LOC141773611 isoform X2 [Sebastes fasciatus]|uniref:uncharacterized protein LOC141773611 isoform X2 n=1 Tax=Sebastes fasciatus TaxID=394691 RepID=UPI003D9EBAFC